MDLVNKFLTFLQCHGKPCHDEDDPAVGGVLPKRFLLGQCVVVNSATEQRGSSYHESTSLKKKQEMGIVCQKSRSYSAIFPHFS